MGAVNVGVRGDDDAVVAELGGVEVVAESRPEGDDERLDFAELKHLIEPRLLDV